MGLEAKTVAIPKVLATVLRTDSDANFFFESLADEHKQSYCDWVSQPKSAETKKNRASKALTRTMYQPETPSRYAGIDSTRRERLYPARR